MIPWLLAPLAGKLPVVSVFRYITFRAAMAALVALILSILLGPALIGWLRSRQIGQVDFLKDLLVAIRSSRFLFFAERNLR